MLHLVRWLSQWQRVLPTVMLFCLCGLGSVAQAQTYAYRNDPFVYDTPSGSATTVAWHTSGASPACTTYFNGDDDWADIAFPSGFSFRFGGTSYTSVRVYSNGILAFPTDTSGFHRDYSSQALPITTAGPTYTGCPTAVPQKLMLVYWLDIVAGTANSTANASIKYELLGNAPNRRLVISWVNVKLYNTTTRYNFQVVLRESASGVNGNFEYRYTTGSSTGANAAVGVQLTTTDYTQYSYNQQFIDTVNGTTITWYPANQLATKAAEYRFDEAVWTGGSGEIKDTSGNSRDATRVGGAASVSNGTFPGGKVCRGGSFTNNTSNSTIDAVATPLVPGSKGTINLWFNSNAKWNANNSEATLFDATTVANRPFYLMKSASGVLSFVVSDSAGVTVTATAPAQSYLANTWHHIGVSWNVIFGTNQTAVQIFMDGVAQNGGPTRGTTSGVMPTLSTLHIGDNRTSGITPSGGTPNGANGSIDEVYVYPTVLSAPQVVADMNTTRPGCTTLDHFHISHDGATSTCTSAASITITAHDASHNAFSLSGTIMNLATATGHGTWSDLAGGAINSLTSIGSGTGAATYTFANESQVSFGLSTNTTEDLNVNVASGSITEHTGSAATCVAADYTNGSVTTCDDARKFICAAPMAFNCIEAGANALSGHLYTKLADTAFSFDVVALKDTNADGTADAVETQYAADSNKSVTVELVDGSGSTTCSLRSALSPVVTQTLTFTKVNQATDQGRKSTSMTVTKANQNLRCRVTDASQSPNIVSCSTDNFAVRPSAVTLNTTATAAAASATDTTTVKAGAAFTLGATTTTGTNYQGNLSLDAGKLTAQTTTQDATQVSGGTVGTLTPASLPTNPSPASSNNATYNEVGYLYLAAGAYRDDSFAAVDSATGDCVTSTTSNANLDDTLDADGKYGCSIGNKSAVSLGRFIPHHFDTVVVQGCAAGSYTYSAQPFSVTATARNLAGGATSNYQGVFAKATTLSHAGTTTNMAGNSLAATAYANGVGTANNVTYTFASRTTNPLELTLRATDSEATSDGATEGTTTIRSGRVRLFNAYGSERLDLPMTMRAEFWNDAWQIHVADSCTTTTLAFAQVGAVDIRANTCVRDSGKPGVSGMGCAAAGVAARSFREGGVAGFAGDFNLWLQAPQNVGGAFTPGSIDVTATVPAWLQFPWIGATATNPSARATFGIYKSPLIYRRENY